jgi:hypothetical protein
MPHSRWLGRRTFGFASALTALLSRIGRPEQVAVALRETPEHPAGQSCLRLDKQVHGVVRQVVVVPRPDGAVGPSLGQRRGRCLAETDWMMRSGPVAAAIGIAASSRAASIRARTSGRPRSAGS